MFNKKVTNKTLTAETVHNSQTKPITLLINIPLPHRELQQVGQAPSQFQQITSLEAYPTDYSLLHCKIALD